MIILNPHDQVTHWLAGPGDRSLCGAIRLGRADWFTEQALRVGPPEAVSCTYCRQAMTAAQKREWQREKRCWAIRSIALILPKPADLDARPC